MKFWKIFGYAIVCVALGTFIAWASFTTTNQKNIPPKNMVVHVIDDPQKDVSHDPALIPETTPPTHEEDHTAPQVPKTATSSSQTKVTPRCPIAPENQTDEWLKAVGPDISISDDYIPNNLVRLENYVVTSKETNCLNASAANRLQEMTQAMKLEHLAVIASSGYRSASYQNTLWKASEAKRDPATDPYPLVALAGHSEHQLGMTVDLVARPDYTLEDFKNTAEYTWLVDHSWEYGFIQSYPVGKESITGYQPEEWHYRYVGLEHAKNIHDQNITIYEYLKNLALEQQPPAPKNP